MSDFIYQISEDSDFLMHHGIKGQKWGERRFQNPDGTLTPEGKARYERYKKEFGKDTANRIMNDIRKGKTEQKAFQREYQRRKSTSVSGRRFKRIARPIGTVVGAAGGGFAGYKLNNISKVPLSNKIQNKPLFIAGGALTGAAVSNAIVNVVAKSITESKRINKINNQYTDYDVSMDGLIRFKRKIDKLQNE